MQCKNIYLKDFKNRHYLNFLWLDVEGIVRRVAEDEQENSKINDEITILKV